MQTCQGAAGDEEEIGAQAPDVLGALTINMPLGTVCPSSEPSAVEICSAATVTKALQGKRSAGEE